MKNMEEKYEEIDAELCEFTNEKRWFFQFFVSILLCINNAACFCFGLFSVFMKGGGFNYSQTQVNIVSTVGVLLSYFSLPTGFLYDRKGTKATILAGTLLNMFGWLGMFLIFLNPKEPLLSNSVFVMCFFYGASQLSASFYETGSVLTNLKSFSCYQGRVVLIQKTFMGLGGSLVAQVYMNFFYPYCEGIAPFFFFLLVFSATSGVLGVLFVSTPNSKTRCLGLNVVDPCTKERGGGESKMFKKPFNYGTALLLFSVFYVLAITLIENYVELNEVSRIFVGISTVALCSLFIVMTFITPSYKANIGGFNDPEIICEPSSPLETPFDEFTARKLNPDDELIEYASDSNGIIEDNMTAVVSTNEAPRNADTYGTLAENHIDTICADDQGPLYQWFLIKQRGPIELNGASLFENLKHREIWLLWYICFASWSAMTLINSNSSQIYQALDYKNFNVKRNTVYVSVFGVASAFGRVVVGTLHPRFQKRRIFISSLLSISPFFNVFGLPLFLFVPASLLFLPFLIVGFSSGVSWGSTVLVVTSLFRSDNCGKHYSWLYTAGMLSPVVFNMGLFAPLYDRYSRLQGHESENYCEGAICVSATMWICTFLNLFAVPASIHLCKRVVERRGVNH